MSDQIRQLEPSTPWNYFADLNAVPRPSKREERVAKFMADFGKSLGLEVLTDTIGNVIIKKPASPAREKSPVVILQANWDMVHQKTNCSSRALECSRDAHVHVVDVVVALDIG